MLDNSTNESDPSIGVDEIITGSVNEGPRTCRVEQILKQKCDLYQGKINLPLGTIHPGFRKCKMCTLDPPCSHVTWNESIRALKDEIQSYPQNPTMPTCEEFNHYGTCTSYFSRLRCHFHHPLEYVVFPVKQKRNKKRCPICTLPNCFKHTAAKDGRNKIERRLWVLPVNSNKIKTVERCYLCTVPLPCRHFSCCEDMAIHLNNEKSFRERYPRDGLTSEKCLYFYFTGNCPAFDSCGTCLYWHPPRYANHAIRLTGELQKKDAEMVGYGHGYRGLPGGHRSTGCYGNNELKVDSVRTARLMINQDIKNIAAARKKLEFGCGRNSCFKKWKMHSPPLSRLGFVHLRGKMSWREKLRRQLKVDAV